jgi:AcrR family transcriptional regulator
MERRILVSIHKNDWFAAGLEILGESGKTSLTIERLTDALGVTKGSFYHHFRNIRDFQINLVSFWADQYLSTSGSIPDDPGACLALLDMIMAEGFTNITKPEIAIRAWAQEDDTIRDLVASIDQDRHAFASNIFWVVSGNAQQATLMADMLFAILIGSITAIPRIEPRRVLDLYAEFKRLYGLDAINQEKVR